jgi:hypothetical protein
VSIRLFRSRYQTGSTLILFDHFPIDDNQAYPCVKRYTFVNKNTPPKAFYTSVMAASLLSDWIEIGQEVPDDPPRVLEAVGAVGSCDS